MIHVYISHHIPQWLHSKSGSPDNVPRFFFQSIRLCAISIFLFFFFNDTATTEIYTLSLHDALPIYRLPLGEDDLGLTLAEEAVMIEPGKSQLLGGKMGEPLQGRLRRQRPGGDVGGGLDRKSTRLNSSH